MPLLITVIDYGAGNVCNVRKAVEFVGCKSVISHHVEAVEQADALILPGVGAFAAGMSVLERLGLRSVLEREVMVKEKPLLGICLGMQLLSIEGMEGGRHPGLGFLPMTVRKLRADVHGLRLPHIGWNEVTVKGNSVLFAGIPSHPDFYFVHSYHAVCEEEAISTATCEYGHPFVAAVEKGNIFATQFHPEKSQRYGLQVLRNFIAYCRSLKRTQAGHRAES